MKGLQWGAGDNSVVQHIKQSLVKKHSTQYLIGVNLMATGCSGLLTLSKRLHVSHSPVLSNWIAARLVVDEISTVCSTPGWLYHLLQQVVTLVMLSWQKMAKLDALVFGRRTSGFVKSVNLKCVWSVLVVQAVYFTCKWVHFSPNWWF